MVAFLLIPQREKQELETLDPFWTPLFLFMGRWCGIQSFSPVQFFVTPWTVAHQALLSIGFPRQECWVGCRLLLQGTLLTQGLNLCLAAPALAGGSLPLAPPGEPTHSGDSNVLRFWPCLSTTVLIEACFICIDYFNILLIVSPVFFLNYYNLFFSNTATMIPLEPESKPVLCSNQCVPSCSE